MDALQPIPCAVVVAAAAVAGVTDIWKFRVYNALTLPLLVAGLVYHGFAEGTPGLVLSVIGMLLGFGVLILFFLLGGYGGGDVKLLAAIGAWLAPWLPCTSLSPARWWPGFMPWPWSCCMENSAKSGCVGKCCGIGWQP